MWWRTRLPEEPSLPRSTQVASVKTTSVLLAAPVAWDGSSGASTAVAAVVPAIQQEPIRWAELAPEQLTCQETQDVLTSHTGLLLEMVVYQGANLWCDTSTRALRPLVPASQRRTVFEHIHGLSHAEWQATWRLAPPALCGLA